MTQNDDADQVLARERHALDQWSQGKPVGYADVTSAEITYFDDIGAQRRKEGDAELRTYLATLEGQIPPHRYTVADPKVQRYGDIAILSFRYEPSTDDGAPLTVWKATSVYHLEPDGVWRIVHGHWSMVKAD